MNRTRMATRIAQDVLAMARGTLVVDGCANMLSEALKAANIHVVSPMPGEKDDAIIQRLLPNRIIVTKNPDDFRGFASSYDIGIIDVSKLKFLDSSPSPIENKTVRLISEVVIGYSLWGKRHGFIITLYDNKPPVYKDLTE